jgi:hypothetical protein
MSEPYRVNGHAAPNPTSFRWLPRRALDVQGDNRPIYPGQRMAEFRFDIIAYEDWETLQNFFDQIQSTGFATINVPAYARGTGTPYAFREYSGCTIAEPQIGPFFEEHPTDVILLIGNIVTE